MSRTLALVTSSWLWLLGGCIVYEDSTAYVDQYGLSPNGLSPNGLSPNEIILNGLSPNGLSPNGVQLNGLSPNGLSPNGTPIGIVGVGTPLSGAELVGRHYRRGLLQPRFVQPGRCQGRRHAPGMLDAP